MKESVSLYFKEGKSDKVYQASLDNQDTGWIVNFAYGRRGTSLKIGTKTPSPLPYEQAKKIYDHLVLEKTGKGYIKTEGGQVFTGTVNESRDTGIRPQLLNEIEESEIEKYLTDDNWCAQEKFDGRRILLYTPLEKTPFGANRKGLTIAIPDELVEYLQFCLPGAVFDGEDLGNKVVIFDLLKGIPENASYAERLSTLNRTLATNDFLRLVNTARTTEEKRELYKNLVDNKAEGIIFKDVRAPYTPGRPSSGGTQVKFKFCSTASCIVTKISTKKRSVEIGVYDNSENIIPVGKATVYPNQEIPEEGSIVEIKYLYYFSGGSLFQPVLLGVRDDIEKNDCTLSKLKLKKEKEDE